MRYLVKVLLPFLVHVAAAERPPNFLLIPSDDHGWSQLSETMDPRMPEAHSSYLETPAIARLMKEGVRFTSGNPSRIQTAVHLQR